VSRQGIATVAVTATVVAGVAMTAIALCVVVVRAHAVVLAFFGAVVVAEAARPLVDRLNARVPRGVALGLTFAGISAAIGLVWALPLRALVPQATAFWSTLPGYLLAVASVIERFLSAGKPANTGLEPALRSVGGAIVPFARGLLDAEAGLAAVASTLVLVLLMAVFWLVSSDTLRGFILSLLGPSARDGAAALLDEMGRKLRLYVSGTLVNGAIVALASTALLLWLRVPFAIVLGLLQGLLVAIPYLGTLIGVLAVGGVVLAGQGWVKAAEAVVLISLLEGFEGSFISPLIFKRGLDLAPLTTVLATAIGGGLLGIDGVVLALPAAVILQVIVVRLLAPAIRRFSKA